MVLPHTLIAHVGGLEITDFKNLCPTAHPMIESPLNPVQQAVEYHKESTMWNSVNGISSLLLGLCRLESKKSLGWRCKQ